MRCYFLNFNYVGMLKLVSGIGRAVSDGAFIVCKSLPLKHLELSRIQRSFKAKPVMKYVENV